MDEFRQMMQLLLADRFKLEAHREMREMPVYALVVAKNGTKLKPSAPDADPTAHHGPSGGQYRDFMPKGTMEDLRSAIANASLGRPIVDKTGLTGTYDIKLTYTPERRNSGASDSDPNDIGIFTALQEQLGLKLEPQKAMIEVLVVDHADKPTAN